MLIEAAQLDSADAVFYSRQAYALPFIPTDWLPTTTLEQLLFSVGIIASASVFRAGISWVQNWGWNAFTQNLQHAIRVDAYKAMQGLDIGFLTNGEAANSYRFSRMTSISSIGFSTAA